MPRVYCVQWSESDEVHGTRNVGWSLHLSRNQATSYVHAHEPKYGAHDAPRCVEVPEEVWVSVSYRREGLFWATPLACPFPVVSDADMEREREVPLASELPEARDDDEPIETEDQPALPLTIQRERDRHPTA